MNFEKYLQKQQFTLNTIQSYTRTAQKLIEWFKSEGLTPEEVRYVDMLTFIRYATSQGHSKRHINGQLAVARHYFNYLIKAGKVKDNVAENLFVKGVSRRLPHDILTSEELESLYENYPEDALTGKRNKVMLGILIYQGVNSSEIAKLEVEHIDLKKGKLYIPGGKRSNSRELPLAAHQILELQSYITQTRPLLLEFTEKKSEKLFTSFGASEKLNNTLTGLIKNLQKYSPEVKSIKQIRMSVITHWLDHFNLREVQYMAGHRYVSSTERYLLTSLDDLQNDLNQYHPLG